MKEVKLFNGLNEKKIEEFIEISKPIKNEIYKDEILTEEGVEVNAFAILLSGKLKVAKYRYDGTLDLIEIYTENELVNLETVCTPTRISPVQISAMEDSEVLLFHRNIIDDDSMPADISRKIHTNIINILANENIKKMYKIDILYKKSLRDRIMVYLRHMEHKLGKRIFHIRMDREQFAQYLGVNRSALSHELSQMKKEDIINFKKDLFELIEPTDND